MKCVYCTGLPPNCWINQIPLYVIHSKVDWRCCMDNIVELRMLCLEDYIECARCTHVFDEDERDTGFPRRMKLDNLLSFFLGSYAAHHLVISLNCVSLVVVRHTKVELNGKNSLQSVQPVYERLQNHLHQSRIQLKTCW
jgi:hypothetical protein